ncbi:recombinase family protein [Nocardioides sp. GY 10113]|nr:recombinase family protein [Nocardioides sp. GY 10113]
MALLGYGRTSRDLQTLGLEAQVTALTEAGCERVWSEHGSGARDDRPEMLALLEYARAGDVIVVVRLDRWGRSLPHLVKTLTALDERGIGFRSLQDGIDTTTDTGRMVYGLMSVLAEFELSLIRARTRAGIAQAAALGHRPGPKPRLSPEQAQMAKRLYNEGEHTVGQIAAMLGGVSRATVYRALEISATRVAAVAATASDG